jgi:hypothetical protein
MPDAPKATANKDHRKRDAHDKAHIILLFLTFIAATAAAIGTFYQAHIFHRQLIEMEKVYVPVQRQAKAATEATKIASETQVSAYRAWLAPRSVEFVGVVEAGKPIRYKVFYQNAGNQPALNVFHARAQRFSRLPPVRENWDTVVGPNEDLCPDAVARRQGPTIFPSSEKGLFTSEQVYLIDEDTAKEKHLFTVIGCFAYETFGVVRQSAYCFYLKPAQGIGTGAASAWEFRPCSNGNIAN